MALLAELPCINATFKHLSIRFSPLTSIFTYNHGYRDMNIYKYRLDNTIQWIQNRQFAIRHTGMTIQRGKARPRVLDPMLSVILTKPHHLYGSKGNLALVKRGYARNHLFPNGLAVPATWENIDTYAKPRKSSQSKSSVQLTGATSDSTTGGIWPSEMNLRIVLPTKTDSKTVLEEPLNVWKILEELSSTYEMDFLAKDFPEIPYYENVGIYKTSVTLHLKTKSHIIPINISIISSQELQRTSEEERKLEQERIDQTTFILPEREQKKRHL